MQKRVHVYISGRVQMVAFRANTQRMATRYALTGWVRNLHDGRVEAVFEGEGENVEAMVVWCRKGPTLAEVEHLDIIEEPFEGRETAFHITY